MVGYRLENTITENGHVARGVCEIGDDGYLKQVTERTKIMERPEGIAFTEDDEKTWTVIPRGTIVSMNFWGFTASMMDELAKGIDDFFATTVVENPLKGEYPLPTLVDKLIKVDKAQVKVLETEDRWCGVTYKADKEDVQDKLQSKKDKGEYPNILWKTYSTDYEEE
jgi:hypothetical protein